MLTRRKRAQLWLGCARCSGTITAAEHDVSGNTVSETPDLSGWPAPPVGDAVSMFAVGSLVAGYRIEHVLATGATGTVYLAKNPTLPRSDALKVLSADLSRDRTFRERFVREADIASLLDHPNIVSIYNRGEADDGQLWIAMQYVAGTDAEAALRAGTMAPARAIRVVGEVAKALDYALQRNVVHHDVKPGNVLITNGSQTMNTSCSATSAWRRRWEMQTIPAGPTTIRLLPRHSPTTHPK
jgi:serine/threonine protein kinase